MGSCGSLLVITPSLTWAMSLQSPISPIHVREWHDHGSGEHGEPLCVIHGAIEAENWIHPPALEKRCA